MRNALTAQNERTTALERCLVSVVGPSAIYRYTTAWVKTVLRWGSARLQTQWSRYQTENVSAFPINGIQGYNGSAIFSVYKASGTGDVRRLIVITKTLHKPDVVREGCRFNQHFVDAGHRALFISPKQYFYITAHLSNHSLPS